MPNYTTCQEFWDNPTILSIDTHQELFSKVIPLVCKLYEVDEILFYSKSRLAKVVMARNIVMLWGQIALARRGRISLCKLASLLGKTHGTFYVVFYRFQDNDNWLIENLNKAVDYCKEYITPSAYS